VALWQEGRGQSRRGGNCPPKFWPVEKLVKNRAKKFSFKNATLCLKTPFLANMKTKLTF